MKRHTTRRAKRVYERLGRSEGRPWVVLVLTTPPEVRTGLLRRATFSRLRRKAIEVARTWARTWMFHGADVNVGGAMMPHPEGDQTPGWAPHFNVIIPAIAVAGENGRIGRWHVPKEALDDLRERWARALMPFGWEPSAYAYPVQVFVEHRHHEHKRHACRYFARSFPRWHSWTQGISWFGWMRDKNCPWVGHEPDFYFERERSIHCECGGTFLTVGVVGQLPDATGPPCPGRTP